MRLGPSVVLSGVRLIRVSESPFDFCPSWEIIIQKVCLAFDEFSPTRQNIRSHGRSVFGRILQSRFDVRAGCGEGRVGMLDGSRH